MKNITNKIKKIGIGMGLMVLPLIPLKAQERRFNIVDATVGKTFNFYTPNSILKGKNYVGGIHFGMYLANEKSRVGYIFDWKNVDLEPNKIPSINVVMLKVGFDYNLFLNNRKKVKGYIGAETTYNELAYNDEEYHKLNGLTIAPKVGIDISLIKDTKIKLTLEAKAESLKLKQYFKEYPEKDIKMKHISLSAKVRF